MKRLSYEDVRSTFEENGCKLLSTEYKNSQTKLHYIATCGHENWITFNRFKNGNSGRVCSICSHSVKYPISYVKERFLEKGCEMLDDKYVNCKTPIRYRAQCGHEAEISFDVFQNCSKASLRCRDCQKITYRDVPIYRNGIKSKEFAREVFKRDYWTCQVCGKHGGKLNAHHLYSYVDNDELRYDVSNGITLCEPCHISFHREYGYGKNTPSQFESYTREYREKHASNIA